MKPKRPLYHWAQLVEMFDEEFCVEALRIGHIEQIVIVWKRQGHDGEEVREVMYYTTVVMCDPYNTAESMQRSQKRPAREGTFL